MTMRYLISCLLIVIIAGCHKQSSNISIHQVMPTPAASTPSNTSHNDSSKATPARTYPYSVSYYGAYKEFNDDVAPYTFTGFSTVDVHYFSADSILITSQSLGVPQSRFYYPDTVYVSTHTNAANTYRFEVRWWDDRTDEFTCTLMGDSCVCQINQSTACAGRYGYYAGSYTGYKH